MYMGMSWCRSFSNLPVGGKGKGWSRRTDAQAAFPTPLLRLSAGCFFCCTGILLSLLLLDKGHVLSCRDEDKNLLHTAGKSGRYPECSYRD